MAKYLDQAGVQILWTKTKEKIVSEIQNTAPKAHTHAISDITNLQSTLDGKQAKLTFDTTPTASSTNPVTSGGIKTALDAKANSSHTHTISQISDLKKGQANGVASLDSNGKVPTSQLPSYVDDVLEFENQAAFPETGEDGKIYVAEDTNKTYRWSGTAYVEISASLALGETSSTAYAGNKGKQNADDIASLKTSKANVSDVYTKDEADTKLEAKQDTIQWSGAFNYDSSTDYVDLKSVKWDFITGKPADITNITQALTNLHDEIDDIYKINTEDKYWAVNQVSDEANPLTIYDKTGQDRAIVWASTIFQLLNKNHGITITENQIRHQINNDQSYEILDESMALTSEDLEAILV